MSVLAAVRPGEWNFPLLVHAFGAMVLVGGLLTASTTLAYARGDTRLLRLGYWSLLALCLPGWLVMRIGAQWIYTKEGWDDLPEGLEPDWLGVGYVVADAGGLLLVISLIIGGIGVYRLRQGKGSGLLRATMILSIILLLAYVVAVWAMAGKPD
jgi:hypothetical protein